MVDDHHTRIVLHKVPRRLIALAANVTETLFALGLGPEVVGVSSYSTYPPAAAKLPIVINYTTLNLEKILRLLLPVVRDQPIDDIHAIENKMRVHLRA